MLIRHSLQLVMLQKILDHGYIISCSGYLIFGLANGYGWNNR
jgi:hypothetical protein